MEQDFVDEMIEEAIKRDPDFLSLMEEARQRLVLLQDLATLRARARISKKTLAKRIKIPQSAIGRLEEGVLDPHLSTIQRYAASIGKRIEWRLVDAQPPENVQAETLPASQDMPKNNLSSSNEISSSLKRQNIFA